MSNTAIILGAGSGTRMKSTKNKMLLEICNKPVIQRSAEAFLDLPDIDEIIITCKEEELEEFEKCAKISNKIRFVIGGATRQESVKNAVDTINKCDLVIIHDGARPLILKEDILNAISGAKEFGASAVGVPVKDTIKIIDSDNFVVSTPDRATLFAVQTPQVFDFKLYKAAMQKAEEEGRDFTDDCQLIEFYGKKVKMIAGDYTNIKITTPDDITVAERIISKRTESEAK